MIQKPEESIRSIAKHMGVAYTSDLIQEVVAACDVEKMRKGKVSLKLNSGKVESELIENYGMFYRKGECTTRTFLLSQLNAFSYSLIDIQVIINFMFEICTVLLMYYLALVNSYSSVLEPAFKETSFQYRKYD